MMIIKKAQSHARDDWSLVVGIHGRLTWADTRSLDGHDGWRLKKSTLGRHGAEITYSKNILRQEIMIDAHVTGRTVTIAISRFVRPYASDDPFSLAVLEVIKKSMDGARLNVQLEPKLDREGFVGVVRPIMARVDAAAKDAEEAISHEEWRSILRGGE